MDSSLADLLRVGLSSLIVATIGVILPFGLGWLVTKVAIFLVGSLALGIFLVPRIMRQLAKAKSKGMLFYFCVDCLFSSFLSRNVDRFGGDCRRLRGWTDFRRRSFSRVS